jgi:hypothetical protein
MNIAVMKDGQIVVGDYRSLFPNTSFPASGPSAEWIAEQGWPVTVFKAHDRATQKLVPVEPYVENGQVFTVAVEPLGANELALLEEAKNNSTKNSIIAATQQRLDAFAQTRNYDGILSACTYATSAVPKFATEGQYCVEVRDTTWAALYDILGEVQAGTRQQPSGFADIESDLPVLTWP